jgi:hypothetical protein
VLVPLYGFLRGDSLGIIVLAHDDETVRAMAATLQRAAAVRVRPGAVVAVYLDGRSLDLDQTVAASGLSPLDRVEVVQEGAR